MPGATWAEMVTVAGSTVPETKPISKMSSPTSLMAFGITKKPGLSCPVVPRYNRVQSETPETRSHVLVYVHVVAPPVLTAVSGWDHAQVYMMDDESACSCAQARISDATSKLNKQTKSRFF